MNGPFVKGHSHRVLTKMRINEAVCSVIIYFVVIQFVYITTIAFQALLPSNVWPSTFNFTKDFL